MRISIKLLYPSINPIKKTRNPDAYFQKHESEIILHGGAKRMLEQAGINTKPSIFKD